MYNPISYASRARDGTDGTLAASLPAAWISRYAYPMMMSLRNFQGKISAENWTAPGKFLHTYMYTLLLSPF